MPSQKVTGYILRDSIKMLEFRVATTLARFQDSLHKFPDETKEDPIELTKQLKRDHLGLAQLRTAQARYNLSVYVTLGEETVCLAELVKRVAALGTIEKLWKDLATARTHSHYGHMQTRDTSQVHAEATTTPQQRTEMARSYAKMMSQWRQAIAAANGREMEIEGLDPSFLE